MKDFNFIDSPSPEVIEDLYELYLKNPEAVDPSWKNFFRGFEYAQLPDTTPKSIHVDVADVYQATSSKTLTAPMVGDSSVVSLIEAYRKLGHLFANTNPLHPSLRDKTLLDPKRWGLTDKDLDKNFPEASSLGASSTKLKDIISHLESTYCGSIGVEYKYISNESLVSWIQDLMEPNGNKINLKKDEKWEVLKDLIHAETFESFINTKYVGKKRFSLEGGTALIPALESLLDYGGSLGLKDVVIGMAHRGRLNVLVNVLKKPYSDMFGEFEGGFLPTNVPGDGDVKYHLGFSSDRVTPSGNHVHVSLCPNPSHLEFVHPVLEGIARSKQDLKFNSDRTKVLPVAIHGDAAFAGQGTVYETINMSQLEGFKTGGTIHIVVNNQVGFTTHPKDSRSTMYCSDIMKMLEVPIFHVNGNDAEAVVHVMHMAIEIRQKFGIDVVVDLICYRKYGHNESDEPRFTQPKMYKIIDKEESPANLYADKLMNLNLMTEADVERITEDFKNHLNGLLDEVRAKKPDMHVQHMKGLWDGYIIPKEKDIFTSIKTGVSKDHLQDIAKHLASLPSNFKPVQKLKRLIKDRWDMAEGKKPMDWGMVENIAYASLLIENYPVRLTGQDVRRGTFSHRHAVWYDESTEERYIPMNHIIEKQEKFSIYDSLLSESGVLGFEYGYSTATPTCLTIWEAQFGDFANGAQVIIDQFITSSESKWQRMSGLVMLLPHAYEGQGPEHSSARLERFLQMAAENNIQVANLTTPAQLFHAMRRQVVRNFRLPLIVMSPKSLLRHPSVVSSFDDLASGEFQEIIPDTLSPTRVKRLVFCTGKIYYDLSERREDLKSESVGIVRIEQLYPLHKDKLEKILGEYSASVQLTWVQEEPENMGAWYFIRNKFEKMGRKISVVARKESASPATGSEKRHKAEQEKIIQRVWEGL
ncbi:MAG: 2-oxoglutarate dehydrogenase E1 component [Bdellovibrionales bacterium]|nr:2-oxoglutarate dehydrogenase E1 component [Bdellovibrionales bacterium]